MLTFNGKKLATGETERMHEMLEALCDDRLEGFFESVNVGVVGDPMVVTYSPIEMQILAKRKRLFEVTIKLVIKERFLEQLERGTCKGCRHLGKMLGKDFCEHPKRNGKADRRCKHYNTGDEE